MRRGPESPVLRRLLQLELCVQGPGVTLSVKLMTVSRTMLPVPLSPLAGFQKDWPSPMPILTAYIFVRFVTVPFTEVKMQFLPLLAMTIPPVSMP